MVEACRQFDASLFVLARLLQLAIQAMRRQSVGRMINISSIGGKVHEPMGSWCHAAKFAVEGLSDCLQMQPAPIGNEVVVIQPSAIRTEWSGIARESLLATSGMGVYAHLARQTAGSLAATDECNASSPEVVAAAVPEALSARRPKTRYIVGAGQGR